VRQAGYKFDGGYNDKNQRHGLGHAEFHNGDIYDGQYENGKRHGHGVYKLVASQYLLNDTLHCCKLLCAIQLDNVENTLEN